ncbi:MAG: hypothetical protein R3C68_03085 [Myxococcota bacterium]
MKLSQRVMDMNEAATLQVAVMARALRAQGKDIIDLGVGEPTLIRLRISRRPPNWR